MDNWNNSRKNLFSKHQQVLSLQSDPYFVVCFCRDFIDLGNEEQACQETLSYYKGTENHRCLTCFLNISLEILRKRQRETEWPKATLHDLYSFQHNRNSKLSICKRKTLHKIQSKLKRKTGYKELTSFCERPMGHIAHLSNSSQMNILYPLKF